MDSMKLTRTFLIAAATLVLGSGVARAAIPNTSDYLHKTTPMISGTVLSVDDRQIVVDTDQGQRVTLLMDSRTMIPVDLAPGMVMRAEFRLMENGQYYANKITPIRGATPSRRADAVGQLDRDASDRSDPQATAAESSPAAAVPIVNDPPATRAASMEESSRTTAGAETLPQTAGKGPWIAILFLLALGGAGVFILARRLIGAWPGESTHS
jgi:hypothetical protein